MRWPSRLPAKSTHASQTKQEHPGRWAGVLDFNSYFLFLAAQLEVGEEEEEVVDVGGAVLHAVAIAVVEVNGDIAGLEAAEEEEQVVDVDAAIRRAAVAEVTVVVQVAAADGRGVGER